MIDEEINVLFKGMLCLRTLEVFVFKRSRLPFEDGSEEVLDLNINFYVNCVVSYRNTSDLLNRPVFNSINHNGSLN